MCQVRINPTRNPEPLTTKIPIRLAGVPKRLRLKISPLKRFPALRANRSHDLYGEGKFGYSDNHKNVDAESKINGVKN